MSTRTSFRQKFQNFFEFKWAFKRGISIFGACSAIGFRNQEEEWKVNNKSLKFQIPSSNSKNHQYLCEVAQWKKKGEDSWMILPVKGESDSPSFIKRYFSFHSQQNHTQSPNQKIHHLIFGVFDGHIGPNLSKIASYTIPLQIQASIETQQNNHDYESILSNSCKNLDSLIMPFEYLVKPNSTKLLKEMVTLAYQGSCACLVILNTKTNEIHVGNVGDSRLIVIDAIEGKVKFETQDANCRTEFGKHLLMNEHPKETETELIQRGFVKGRIMPVRTLGDAHLKLSQTLQDDFALQFRGAKDLKKDGRYDHYPYLLSTPIYSKVAIDFQKDVLLLVSDGVTDYLTSEEIAELCTKEKKRKKDDPDYASVILEEVLKRSSESGKHQDDVTIIASSLVEMVAP